MTKNKPTYSFKSVSINSIDLEDRLTSFSLSTPADSLQKSIEELSELLGEPDLIRKDGKTTYLRFDSNNCRLFVFLNSSSKKSYAEYYELRNSNGELIDRQNDIEFCFKEIKSV